MSTDFWADSYVEKKKTIPEAISLIRPGQRVYVGSSSGEPQALIRGLAKASDRFMDIEIVRLQSMENTSLAQIADKTRDEAINIRSFYTGSASMGRLAENRRFLTPVNLSYIPRIFKNRLFPLHVALIQVTPPDDFGWMSLGVSVDITLAAAQSADIVIAQVNSKMPWVLGAGFIHVNDVDVVVEQDEELITISDHPGMRQSVDIAQHIARLVDDGSTIQIGLGATTSNTLMALSEKNDLGVHSQFITDGMMRLVSKGVITNRQKRFNDGKMVASSAIGTNELYEFLNYNPSVDFRPSDYVCDPRVISRHNRMVVINIGMAIDLTGQVAVEALPFTHFSGVTGINDFIRGAALAKGGKSILAFRSVYDKGRKSCVVPQLNNTAVVVPMSDVNYVVTEYGAVNLLGKSYQDRAMAIISIAHPDYREELFHEAKKMGLISAQRELKKNLHGVYPLRLESSMVIRGEKVTIRPAKPVDERRIQEHFYSMEKDDVKTRFFHAKKRFVRDEMEEMSQIDYIKHLTVVAIVGEFGFGRVVGVGEYFLVESDNMAEVAFSVSSDWQGRGLGTILMRKLAHAARENGISGLNAFVMPGNNSMINLFRTLPYKVRTVGYSEMELSCRFDELETERKK